MDKKVKIFGHVLLSWIKSEQFLSTLNYHALKSAIYYPGDNRHAQEIALSCAKNQSMHKNTRFLVQTNSSFNIHKS